MCRRKGGDGGTSQIEGKSTGQHAAQPQLKDGGGKESGRSAPAQRAQRAQQDSSSVEDAAARQSSVPDAFAPAFSLQQQRTQQQ